MRTWRSGRWPAKNWRSAPTRCRWTSCCPTTQARRRLRRAHGLWLAERRTPGGLSDESVERLAADPSRLVRVHLLKALAERENWSDSGGKLDVAGLMRSKLSDDDAFVRRAAADALGRHPQVESIEPLLALWSGEPADDTHLIHVVRMALRDHLLSPGMYEQAKPLLDGRSAIWPGWPTSAWAYGRPIQRRSCSLISSRIPTTTGVCRSMFTTLHATCRPSGLPRCRLDDRPLNSRLAVSPAVCDGSQTSLARAAVAAA